MKNSLRKIVYIIFLIVFTLFGIIGFANRSHSSKQKPAKPDNSSNNLNNSETEYLICTITSPVTDEETNETLYNNATQIIFSLKDNKIEKTVVNVSKIYSEEEKYNAFKEENKEETKYTFDDTNKTVKSQEDFDNSLIEGVNPTKEDLKKVFLDKEYNCN